MLTKSKFISATLAALALAGCLVATSGNAQAHPRFGVGLGIGIATLINLFNPKKIIISGEGAREGDFLFIPMKESIQQNTMPGLFDPDIVEIIPWGDDAWARGAAGLVLREVFESPIHKKVISPILV